MGSFILNGESLGGAPSGVPACDTLSVIPNHFLPKYSETNQQNIKQQHTNSEIKVSWKLEPCLK